MNPKMSVFKAIVEDSDDEIEMEVMKKKIDVLIEKAKKWDLVCEYWNDSKNREGDFLDYMIDELGFDFKYEEYEEHKIYEDHANDMKEPIGDFLCDNIDIFEGRFPTSEFEAYDENKQYICCECKKDYTDECDERSSFAKSPEGTIYMCGVCFEKE